MRTKYPEGKLKFYFFFFPNIYFNIYIREITKKQEKKQWIWYCGSWGKFLSKGKFLILHFVQICNCIKFFFFNFWEIFYLNLFYKVKKIVFLFWKQFFSIRKFFSVFGVIFFIFGVRCHFFRCSVFGVHRTFFTYIFFGVRCSVYTELFLPIFFSVFGVRCTPKYILWFYSNHLIRF